MAKSATERFGNTRFKCAVCGKVTTGRRPKGGDGTFMFPRRHLRHAGGQPCPGSHQEAEWVDANG